MMLSRKVMSVEENKGTELRNVIYPGKLIWVNKLDEVHITISNGTDVYLCPKGIFTPDKKEEFEKLNDGEYLNITEEFKLPTYIWNLITFNKYKGERYGGYEVSSRGDKNFSAFYAYLPNNISIEEYYQLDVKGWRAKGLTTKEAKGKAPLIERTLEETKQIYTELWYIYCAQNPERFWHLCETLFYTKQTVLSDMFANGPISQANSIAEVLNSALIMKYGIDSKYERIPEWE